MCIDTLWNIAIAIKETSIGSNENFDTLLSFLYILNNLTFNYMNIGPLFYIDFLIIT